MHRIATATRSDRTPAALARSRRVPGLGCITTATALGGRRWIVFA
jgi:hypothetical protein